ncbi:hypothetical protein ACVRXQ_02815 [Streptococcus panodentis]|uniref:DUF1828 domain-containing protein n=1 Tax=Streptococcus panodentis TaxID=1581472 RepID=A0ABS5AZ00_9STRE|nr:hypothetical protein [Streptococcus panodentis]MBP2621780.1 hypothetical protein [Streptococcus panodentis]
MVFVNELVPLEYKEMLENLGFDDIRFEQQSWTADKGKGVFLWITRNPYRDDYSTDYILIWENQVIELNITTVDTSARPVWDEAGEILVQKGLAKERINAIRVPESVLSKEQELLKIIEEVFKYVDKEWETEFVSVPKLTVLQN